jgi:hypothetical protein
MWVVENQVIMFLVFHSSVKTMDNSITMQNQKRMSSNKFTGQMPLFRDEDEEKHEDNTRFDIEADTSSPYPLKIHSKSHKNDAAAVDSYTICFDKNFLPFEAVFPDDINPFRQPEDTNPFRPPCAQQETSTSPKVKITAVQKRRESLDQKLALIRGEEETKTSENDRSKPQASSTANAVYSQRVPSTRLLPERRSDRDASEETKIDIHTDDDQSQTTRLLLLPDDSRMSKLRLYIDEYQAVNFYQIVQELRGDERIVKLVLRRSAEHRDRSAKDLSHLFQALRTLPNLKILHLDHFNGEGDLMDLHEALYAHPTLQCVQLNGSAIVEPITLRTLTTIPYLTQVKLQSDESFPFDILLRSTTLRKLTIAASSNNSYCFENAHLMALVQMLETNSTLHELDLEPSMSFIAFKLLAYALRVNTCLQSFRVSIGGAGTVQEADGCVDEITKVLEQNSTLQTLWNLQYSSLQVSTKSQNKILKALEFNTTMKSFLFFEEDDADFRAQKLKLIQRNNQKKPYLLRGFPSCGPLSALETIKENPPIWYQQAKTQGIKITNEITSSLEGILENTKSLHFLHCRSGKNATMETTIPMVPQ